MHWVPNKFDIIVKFKQDTPVTQNCANPDEVTFNESVCFMFV